MYPQHTSDPAIDFHTLRAELGAPSWADSTRFGCAPPSTLPEAAIEEVEPTLVLTQLFWWCRDIREWWIHTSRVQRDEAAPFEVGLLRVAVEEGAALSELVAIDALPPDTDDAVLLRMAIELRKRACILVMRRLHAASAAVHAADPSFPVLVPSVLRALFG